MKALTVTLTCSGLRDSGSAVLTTYEMATQQKKQQKCEYLFGALTVTLTCSGLRDSGSAVLTTCDK